MGLLQIYLSFNGNCREAATFYNEAIGGELNLMTFGDSPMSAEVSEADKARIMHATITKGDFVLMASDSMPGQDVSFGSAVQLSIACTSEEEIDFLFPRLSEGGHVIMPLNVTFWNAKFGMFIDKFGIPWMLNYQIPQA